MRKQKILGAFSAIIMAFAAIGISSASVFVLYQPKAPKSLSK